MESPSNKAYAHFFPAGKPGAGDAHNSFWLPEHCGCGPVGGGDKEKDKKEIQV